MAWLCRLMLGATGVCQEWNEDGVLEGRSGLNLWRRTACVDVLDADGRISSSKGPNPLGANWNDGDVQQRMSSLGRILCWYRSEIRCKRHGHVECCLPLQQHSCSRKR